MKVEASEVQTKPTGFEQGLTYQVGPKVRREIFVGRTQEELSVMIRERRRELERL
jgi:hypothetical protein